MTISIIIPAYNTGGYIRQAVASVQNQTYDDWELIIVDDGSTDCTGIICDEISVQDGRIKVFHTLNRGAYQARLTGVRESKGKWIMFMDSDDSLTPESLTELSKYTGGDHEIIVGTLNIDDSRIFQNKVSGELTSQEYIKALLLSQTTIGPVSKLFNRTLFENLIVPKIRITNNEDLMLLIQLAKKSNHIYIDNNIVCYNYMHRPDSAVSNIMNVDKWQYLFDYIKDILSNIWTLDLNLAMQHMMLNRAFHNMILKGVVLDDKTPFVFELKNCNVSLLSKEDRKYYNILKSPIRQKIEYKKFCAVRSFKSFIKKMIGRREML